MTPLRLRRRTSILAFLALVTALAFGVADAGAVGPGFTYQGNLKKSGTPVNASCDFQLSLWDAAAAGGQIGAAETLNGVAVSGGVFTVVVNAGNAFGTGAFSGPDRWLDVQVQCPGDGGYTDLGRQQLTTSPFATFASTAGTVSSTAGDSIVTAINDPATTTRFSNYVALGTGSQSKGTSSSLINIIQTGDGDLLRLRENGVPICGGPVVNRTQFLVDSAASLTVRGDIGVGCIQASGAGVRLMWYPFAAAFRAGEVSNVQWDHANIGFYSWAGGLDNTASGTYAVALGYGNNVNTGQAGTALGLANTVTNTGGFAVGTNNSCGGNGCAVLGKTSQANGRASIALGERTFACGDHDVVVGNMGMTSLTGDESTPCTGGTHTGSFLYADTSDSNYFRSTNNNEFAVRAAGGVRLRTNGTLTTGCNLPPGSGVFNCTSDRNLKRDFRPLDGESVLAKLAGIPIGTWSYETEKPSIRHAGPAAQDFRAAFGLGTDDRTIGMIDEAGVALRAIQALDARARQVRALKARVAKLESANAAFEARLAALERKTAR
jgi:hypothetical protein